MQALNFSALSTRALKAVTMYPTVVAARLGLAVSHVLPSGRRFEVNDYISDRETTTGETLHAFTAGKTLAEAWSHIGAAVMSDPDSVGLYDVVRTKGATLSDRDIKALVEARRAATAIRAAGIDYSRETPYSLMDAAKKELTRRAAA